MSMIDKKIRGYNVVAWGRIEIQDGKECGIALVEMTPTDPTDPLQWGHYVTVWYREGDHEWSHGNYFEGERALNRARNDFWLRWNRYGSR